ncbi:MAG: DUF1572 family protein [Gemmatimonadetes bacterium]|nr:DUF1572 family protein [Gemmatimonadota bacterium]
MDNTLFRAIVDAVHRRLVEDYPQHIRTCLDRLTDEQVWWRPHEEANAIGNLILHLCGNIRHYVWRGVGGLDYARDRPAEFAERGPVPREELRRRLDESIEGASRILLGLGPDDLIRSPHATEYPSVQELLQHVLTHFGYHTGQIVYATKLLTGTGFAPELTRVARRPH